MLHLADGTLRRLLDEPDSLPDALAHLERCDACHARLDRIGDAADGAATALTVTDAPGRPDGAVLAQVQARLLTSPTQRPAVRFAGFGFPSGAMIAAGAAAVVAMSFAFAPVRTLATNFLAIFEPRQFLAIPITQADAAQLRALPDLDAYGTVRGAAKGPIHTEVTTAQAASRLARIAVAVPTYLPPDARAQSRYVVMNATSGTFTFSATRARATAAKTNASLPPMPPNIDGSTLQVSIGPVVVGLFGSAGEVARFERFQAGRPSHARMHAALHHGDFSGVAIVQSPAPRVWSTGASVADIEAYLLAQPGVPARLAAEIRAIGDPASTLPIPIPIEREYAQPVVVNGVQGLGIGDNTGLGAAVLWQTGGRIYAVAGTYPAREVLAIANSLR